jgi:hypothetical protein
MKVVAGHGGVEVVAEPAAATVVAAGQRTAKRRRVAADQPAPAPAGVRRRGRRLRRVQADAAAAAAAVQRLFQACRDVFRGPGTVPGPDEVRLLSAMLGALPLITSAFLCSCRVCVVRCIWIYNTSSSRFSLPKKVAQNFLNFEAWWWSNPLFTESVITRNRVIVNRLNRNCFGGTGSTSAFLCSCVCV